MKRVVLGDLPLWNTIDSLSGLPMIAVAPLWFELDHAFGRSQFNAKPKDLDGPDNVLWRNFIGILDHGSSILLKRRSDVLQFCFAHKQVNESDPDMPNPTERLSNDQRRTSADKDNLWVSQSTKFSSWLTIAEWLLGGTSVSG